MEGDNSARKKILLLVSQKFRCPLLILYVPLYILKPGLTFKSHVLYLIQKIASLLILASCFVDPNVKVKINL